MMYQYPPHYAPHMYRPYTPHYTPHGVRALGQVESAATAPPLRAQTPPGFFDRWLSGADVVDTVKEQGVYDKGYRRGLIAGASAVGIIWAGFIGWYMWRNR